MFACTDNNFPIAIIVAICIALPQVLLLPAQVSSRTDDGKDTADGDLIIDQSINKFSSSDGENSGTSTHPSYDRPNEDSEQGNSDNEKNNLLINGISNIKTILPPDKLNSGEIVNVKVDGGKNSLIVRGDPLDPTEYLVCTSNRINYECISHSYPDGKE